MCGRFTQKTPAADLAHVFELDQEPSELGPRFNIAPTQPVLVIANRPGPRRAEVMRWGLVPPWATDPAIGNQLVNARSETAATKPSFRQALRQRRGLLLMDGFFEWQALGKLKVPHYFQVADRGAFAVAALWEQWAPAHDPAQVLTTCALLTTAPNPTVAALHDRMAVILPRSAWTAWLDPQPCTAEALAPLLVPYVGELAVTQVSSYVNVAGHQGAQCIEPANNPAPSPRQQSLF